jgi:CxxC-x17-CxxC domain-containing protein
MERCYEAINVHESSGIVFGQNITSSVDCWFGLNLSGCQNCFGCVNLTNKTDHWFNEPIARDEYARRLAEVRGSFSKMQEMQKKFQEFSLQFPRRQNNNTKSVNSVGDYLFECNNVSHCFEQTACEDCKFGFSNKNTKDSYDIIGYGYDSELLLDCCATGLSSRVIGSYFVESCHQVEYSFFIRNSHDCVGCDALKNGEYCILNEKYSKEEYESLRQHIIEELRSLGEYGLFMPPSIAPFAYNETIGQDNLPLTQAVAESYGYRWQPDAKRTTGKETILPEDLPNNIKGVSDSILKEVLRCTVCSRNYLITPAELAFYRDMNLPLPRKCFFCRHANRLERRGPMKIYQRVCAKCNKSIETPYAPERPETVYCESCYQEAVV